MDKNFSKWAFVLNAVIGAILIVMLTVLIVKKDKDKEKDIADRVERVTHENMFLLYSDWIGHLQAVTVREKEKILRRRLNDELIRCYNISILGPNDYDYAETNKEKTVSLSEIQTIRLTLKMQYPLRSKFISSPFGIRANFLPANAGGPSIQIHRGDDFPADRGTRIESSADGYVEDRGYNNSYGYFIITRHTQLENMLGRKVEILYAHLSRIDVKKWDNVDKGQIIGRVGNTGIDTTGSHLHFQVMIDGEAVDPMYLLCDKND